MEGETILMLLVRDPSNPANVRPCWLCSCDLRAVHRRSGQHHIEHERCRRGPSDPQSVERMKSSSARRSVYVVRLLHGKLAAGDFVTSFRPRAGHDHARHGMWQRRWQLIFAAMTFDRDRRYRSVSSQPFGRSASATRSRCGVVSGPFGLPNSGSTDADVCLLNSAGCRFLATARRAQII